MCPMCSSTTMTACICLFYWWKILFCGIERCHLLENSIKRDCPCKISSKDAEVTWNYHSATFNGTFCYIHQIIIFQSTSQVNRGKNTCPFLLHCTDAAGHLSGARLCPLLHGRLRSNSTCTFVKCARTTLRFASVAASLHRSFAAAHRRTLSSQPFVELGTKWIALASRMLTGPFSLVETSPLMR